MKITNILPDIKFTKNSSIQITGICDDTRIVKKGDAFFIIERKNFDIFSAIKQLEDKVSVFVADIKDKKKVLPLINKKPIIFVKNIKEHFFKAVDLYYNFNTYDFNFIGVTGTNGKTTVTTLIYHILKNLRYKTALLGTIKYIIGNKEYPPLYTTPDYLLLRKILSEAKKKGVEYVVMEVSSHALVQDRVKGIQFLRCVFTNLTRDHLDYHKTMKDYFIAKCKLFIENKNALAIINTDDFYGKKIAKLVDWKLTYCIENKADIVAKNISLSTNKTEFDFVYKDTTFHIKTHLLGRHNVYNILAAVGCVISYGFSIDKIISLVASFKGVEGRLEQVVDDIFVDYAHTPDALKKVILTLRQIGYEEVICVFGCGGDRDKGKRPLMGRVADKYADFTFITSDNPRSENPILICKQIEKGFSGKNYKITIDRKCAIKEAINLWKKKFKKGNKCCILVAGKGHENCQIIKDKKIPFKDSKIIRTILKNEF
ncbi:MAG: UDP-N-acetylmuramoyl-L-alanyl-D-glutamate--2,6-diaminopimelate ligase [Candidatus Omnitrophica bacterium]|nr:UDP-N-acetylmuramoyl-L-alanyl-D-glutamate--2,6-diaminopimelate ligase [Candidatus Omnitrophota bacterium]